MKLQALQRAFQARILSDVPGIEAGLENSSDLEFENRLNTYVDGYRLRLVEALSTTYPVLKLRLGAGEFERHMREFINTTASRHYSIRYYGSEIANYVSRSAAQPEGYWRAEIARWEWLLADVFDAADDEPMSASALAGVAPEAWPTLSFTVRESVRRFETSSNIVEWWRAVKDSVDEPALRMAQPTRWLLWRQNLKVMFRSLDAEEAGMLDQLGAGATFGTLCDRLAEMIDVEGVPLRAALLLRGWIEGELISGFSETGRNA